MSEQPISFEVSTFWYLGSPPRASYNYHLKTDRPDVWEWMSAQTFLGDWSVELKVLDGEYDTGQIKYGLNVVYQNPNDAFHHRMRW
jgi:hypothetical protein